MAAGSVTVAAMLTPAATAAPVAFVSDPASVVNPLIGTSNGFDDFPGADVEQQYLPDRLTGRRYYEPSEQGMERQIGERLGRLRNERKDRRKGT